MDYARIAKKAEELKAEIEALYTEKFTDEAGPQYHISNVIAAEAAKIRCAQREARLAKAQVMAANFSGDVMMHVQEIFEAGWRDDDTFRLQKAFSITPEQAQEMLLELAKMEEHQRLEQIADQVYEASVLLRGFADEEPEEDLPEGYVFPLNIE